MPEHPAAASAPGAQSTSAPLPVVVADGPLAPNILERLAGKVNVLPWSALSERSSLEEVAGLYTYGHPAVDGSLLDLLPNLKVISNYGVGVDHIVLAAAAERGLPVGNTPGILDGATADMGLALLLASARRVTEGDQYARGPQFTVYDPGYMLGREVHHATLGILGMGREVARRGAAFSMRVLYHNRRPLAELPPHTPAEYVSFAELLRQSDFLLLSLPLTAQSQGIMNSGAFAQMKPTATLINIARGPVVVTADLVAALESKQIAAAALDVTDPEPLPRNHPLLNMPNVIVTPHLGSATTETRDRMAEMSVTNLLAGLAGEPLPWPVG